MHSDLAVAHVVAGLHPRGGGPSRTVVQLCDALAQIPHRRTVLVSQGARGEAAVPSSVGQVERRLAESASRIGLGLGLPVLGELRRLFAERPPDIVHNHGLWLPVNHWAVNAARRLRVPLVVHPRGMLEPWAMQHKRYKKALSMYLFQRRDLAAAKVIVATSEAEAESVRGLGFRQAIAVIPNGVVFDRAGASTVQAAGPSRVALFLSRVHPKKGLLNLVEAWGRVRPAGWELHIAGPDEGGHLAEVMNAVERHRVTDSVRYIGEVDGPDKSAAYRNADVFVLPTFSENFGVVVAEALAHGVPVITTRGTPWADLETHGCGWWIDIGVEPLVAALRTAASMPGDALAAMGHKGLAYVRRYDWQHIAVQTDEVYQWVLGRSSHRPDCVHTW